MGKVINGIKNFLILPIKIYQYFLSPLVGQRCCFYPSCSCFAIDAIKSLGFIHGCYLTLHRLLRCHPWSQGGYDPVPERKTKC